MSCRHVRGPLGGPVLGFTVVVGDVRLGLLPAAGLTVNLKPGVVNIIPVTKKQFTGGDPWVMISGFSLKIDGCVGYCALNIRIE